MKNRIVETTLVPIDDILFNPKNWRIHPEAQQQAIGELLSDVGWVQSIVINKRTGHLIDGHARVQVAKRQGQTEVPAMIVDLTEEEEKLVLATLDSTTAMAAIDKEKYAELMIELKDAFSGSYNALMTEVSHAAFDVDLQPMFETHEFAEYLNELMQEEEADDATSLFDEQVEFYKPTMAVVKLDIAMSKEQKDFVMDAVSAVSKAQDIPVAEALVAIVRRGSDV